MNVCDICGEKLYVGKSVSCDKLVWDSSLKFPLQRVQFEICLDCVNKIKRMKK